MTPGGSGKGSCPKYPRVTPGIHYTRLVDAIATYKDMTYLDKQVARPVEGALGWILLAGEAELWDLHSGEERIGCDLCGYTQESVW